MNKKIIYMIIIGVIVVLGIVGILVYFNKDNDTHVDEKPQEEIGIVNDSQNFKQDKEFKDLVLSDIEFIFKENESTINALVTNNSVEKLENITLDVVLLDEQRNEKGSIYIYIYELNGKESKKVSGSIDQNYIDAYDCYIRY